MTPFLFPYERIMGPNDYKSLSPELLAEFSAGAGHDLNNPLAAISGRVQMMLREESDPAKRADLAVILTQVKRAQEMISDLRLTSRPPKPQKSEILLKAFVEDLRESWADAFREQKVEFLANGPTDLYINADETQMMVLFRALIKNALRALGGAGFIRIAWEVPSEGRVKILVSDSGPGIPQEIRPLIFDPYFSSYQSGRGLGFGLTKARIIAQMHGGDVTLDESARETTFVVELGYSSGSGSIPSP